MTYAQWAVTPEQWRVPVRLFETRLEAEAYAADCRFPCSVAPVDPTARREKIKPTRQYALIKGGRTS